MVDRSRPDAVPKIRSDRVAVELSLVVIGANSRDMVETMKYGVLTGRLA